VRLPAREVLMNQMLRNMELRAAARLTKAFGTRLCLAGR
jgi:hypothetical protein